MKFILDNLNGKIDGALTLDQLHILSDLCSFEVQGSKFKSDRLKATKGYDWDGRRRLFDTQRQQFPIGLFNLISSFLTRYGIQYQVEDIRKHSEKMFECTPSNYNLRNYQSAAVMSSLLNGGGIIKSATGSGKTTIAALTIGALGRNTVFIVHTKDLLYQAKESFERILGIKIGQIGDGVIDIDSPVVVATVQSLSIISSKVEYESYSYDEDDEEAEQSISIDKRTKDMLFKWVASVGLVQFDEVQRVASRTAFSARNMFYNADFTFGYSASPWRDDGADIMIEAAFGHRIVDISASELIRQGHLVKPYITVETCHAPVWSGESYNTIYRTGIVENVMRNGQVCQAAIKEYNAGKNTLILVTQIKHGQMIEEMLRGNGIQSQFISGKSKPKVRQQVIQDMRSGKAPLVIASTIADVGLDVPRLDSLVEAGAGKSSVTALQRVGRLMRPFGMKTSCNFITFRDNIPIICRHIDKKIQIWSQEEEFVITQR